MHSKRFLCKIYQIDVLKLYKLIENIKVKLKTSALCPIKRITVTVNVYNILLFKYELKFKISPFNVTISSRYLTEVSQQK